MATTPSASFVLVTGSAGHIGRVVVDALRRAGHRVRGLDRVRHPDLADQVVADLTDADAVRHAVEGVDQVVHLAAYPTIAPFVQVLLPSNILGLYHVATAAVEARVKRLTLASSIQVIGRPGDDVPRPISTSYTSPKNDYGLTKVWAEHLGQMLARNHDWMEVIAARIGWLVRHPDEIRRIAETPYAQSVYLARSDAAQFFLAAVQTPTLDAPHGYATLYAVGPGTDDQPCPVDLEPGRRLIGYEPRAPWPAELPTP